ncbi:ThiF family adenylyltransferase [Jannaschia rubra]|uniref:ThiF family adenylyltransferase n=1 Tax=Jannaschia rubra TaxID=282197 RepID=UPI0024935628|nr:ThiF family adenylyltransferase [Jannaschia rubra]
MDALDLILLDPHEAQIRSLLTAGAGSERSAYMLFGIADIESDPWSDQPRRRLASHRFDPIGDDDLMSASGCHVTWQTDGFMRLLNEAKTAGLIPALVHTHPKGKARFSEQDDRNEAELARTALLKGMPGLVSIIIAENGDLAARIWTTTKEAVDVVRILHSGPRLRISGLTGTPANFLDRQVRLFGDEASRQVSGFRCGIAGGGATGSAVLPLLLRLGVKEAVQFDKDVVDLTNLNRLHGARRSDVDAKWPKTAIHARTVEESGLGMTLVSIDAWAGDPVTWDALKACDVIFCCTDDHAGRLFLNRFARFYGIPVIDVGLAMQRRTETVYDLFARVSTLVPGHPCLLCGGYVDPRRAREETLRRDDPDSYERLKEEAYVLGEGDPSPAVVTFTTEAGAMAVNEWLAGITGLAGEAGMLPTRMRRFRARDERKPLVEPQPDCPCCSQEATLGRADMQPFLDVVS